MVDLQTVSVAQTAGTLISGATCLVWHCHGEMNTVFVQCRLSRVRTPTGHSQTQTRHVLCFMQCPVPELLRRQSIYIVRQKIVSSFPWCRHQFNSNPYPFPRPLHSALRPAVHACRLQKEEEMACRDGREHAAPATWTSLSGQMQQQLDLQVI
jgi:hypothetical protein